MTQPRFNNLPDWLAWQETAHPSAIDLGLGRVIEVAGRLDIELAGALLTPGAKVITIAGTNGKGSCVAALTSLLLAQGKHLGAYTSPHFLSYNERVQIDGKPVTDAALCDAFAAIDKARGAISLTYFEFGTLAALWLFAQARLDFWLLEVGLGGRLDATNIIDANIAVITSIDLDHQAWLGDNREAIGFEKAGICRATGELVCVDPQPPTSVITHVNSLHCPAYWLGQDFSIASFATGRQIVLSPQWSLELSAEHIHLPIYSLAAALKVCERLNLLPAPDIALDVLAKTHLAGRFQRVFFGRVEIILDVAHNPAATGFLAQQLHQSPERPTLGIFGMMADKDIAGSLAPLVAVVDKFYCTSLPDIQRAASAEVLAAAVAKLGGSGEVFANVPAALDAALQAAELNSGRVVIAGSFYTLTAAFAYLIQKGVMSRG